MTPKEKAKELYWKYYQNISDTSFPEETAKKCALIAVDEILNYQNQLLKNYKFKIENSFYEQVKQEIENL
jgi:hypothetical protein